MLQQVYAVCSVNEKNGFLVVKQGERSMQIGSLGKKISKRLFYIWFYRCTSWIFLF